MTVLKTALLVVAVLGGGWLLALAWSIRRLLRESRSLNGLFEDLSAVRWEPLDALPWRFRFGPGARVLGELRAAGFREVGSFVQSVGDARLPLVVLLSEDRTVEATVGAMTILPLGQVHPFVGLVSITENDVYVYTGGAPLPSGVGLVVQHVEGGFAERSAAHRERLEQQPTAAVPLESGIEAAIGRGRELLAREARAQAAGVRAAPGLVFVDGRAAAEAAGLSGPPVPELRLRFPLWPAVLLGLWLGSRIVGGGALLWPGLGFAVVLGLWALGRRADRAE